MPRMTPDELDTRYAYHAPTPEKAATHNELREKVRELAEHLNTTLPPSREAEKAQEALEVALFYANAAVARRG